MRIVKDAAERKNEILDAAEMLFNQKGFDGTSTNDILNKVNIARGTLYYHFKSKEHIMDALIDRYSDTLLAAAKEIAENKSLPVIERLLRAIMALNLSVKGSQEIMTHIHKPQNALLHQKIQSVIVNGVTPILTSIIRDGIEQGQFNTPYPYESMEMIIVYSNTVFDDNNVDLLSEVERLVRIQAFIFNVERLLGVKNGALKDVLAWLLSKQEN